MPPDPSSGSRLRRSRAPPLILPLLRHWYYSFLGNETIPNLYDALVYERKFKSEYLERQIYERLLKS